MDSRLKELLSNLPKGPVEDSGQVQQALIDEWDTLDGSSDGGMRSEKLSGRIENLMWDPPSLTFTIERHGGTVLGSSRAELHDWTVNLSTWTAEVSSTRRRQLRPAAKKLDVKPIAEKVADAITNNLESESLKRYPDGRVKVLVGSLVTASNNQTQEGRRRRLRKAIDALMSARGWTTVGFYTYVLKQQK